MDFDSSFADRIVKDIPDYGEFLTVEELNRSSVKLAREYPSVVELTTVGRSRDGDLIQALIIGKGERTAFLFGTPHPNEPIGSMMLEFLSRKLAEDREFREWTGLRWVLIKCADPDGTRLNEGWFKGPFTPLHYARNFYRPPHFQQVEWSFPVKYKRLVFDSPIPETRSIMHVIDTEKPVFMFSLHNAGFGGAYYYVSEHCESLYETYREAAIRQEIPLQLGEPEMPYAKQLSDAVYLMPSIKDNYDYLEEYTDKDPLEVINGGAGSTDYAQRVVPDIFSLVCEVPYFYDNRIDDLRESEVKRRDAVLDSVELSSKMVGYLKDKYREVRSLLTATSRFKEAIEENIRVVPRRLEAKRRWAETAKELEVLATISQEFDNRVINRFYNMLSLGMFVRMLDHQLQNTEGAEEKRRLGAVKREVEEELAGHNEKLLEDLNYEAIPIRRLVAVQFTSALATINYLKGKEVRKS